MSAESNMAEGTTPSSLSASIPDDSSHSKATSLVQHLSSKLKGFNISECIFDDQCCLVLTHKKLYNHPPVGPTSRVRILVKGEEYVVHVLLREVERGGLDSSCPENELLLLCKKYTSDSQTYKFCPGIDCAEYERMKEIICFDLKSAFVFRVPFIRVESVKCLLWFQLGVTCKPERRYADSVVCQSCVKLKCDLERQVNRTESESPSKKLNRQGSSSRARLTYMSPASQKKRRVNQQNERKNLKKKLLQYDNTTVTLDDHQADKLSAVTSIIENNHQEELEKLYCEGE